MGPILYRWHFDLPIVLMAIGLLYLYYKLTGFRWPRKSVLFILAMLLFLLVTCSPPHYLGMHNYLSAHMIGHILLLLICGPLMVFSLPEQPQTLRRFSSFLSKRAWLAWMTGVGIMWFWHIPSIFNHMMSDMPGLAVMPLLQAASLLFAGILFGWPLFGPYPEDRVHPLSGIIYLAAACISCSLMGLLITFAPLDTYYPFAGIKRMDNLWGISPKEDLQTAGLIMWVPCCLLYLGGCLLLLRRWLTGDDRRRNKHIIAVSN